MADGKVALVKGGGEVGTKVALALWQAGWAVVVTELPHPTVLRRQLSVAEAAYAGAVWREGVLARHAADTAALARLLTDAASRALPLYTGSLAAALELLRPAVVVDARMRRLAAEATRERQRGEAPLVIGLGPTLCAGDDVDVVIETCPGPQLGRVISSGSARPHTPLRRPAGAVGAEQYAYAPVGGLWQTARAIGDVVVAGDALGTLDGRPLVAPTDGCIRGLAHGGVRVRDGLKVAAVHPGDWQRKEAGITCRAAEIAASVLALVDLVPRAAAPPAVAAAS